MKEIMILAPHLGYGGIQKSIMTFLKTFSDSYKITLIVENKTTKRPAYKIPKNVDVQYLINNLEINSNYIQKITKDKILAKNKLKKIVLNDNFDFIISINSKYGSIFKKTKAKKIAWDHEYHQNTKKFISQLERKVKFFDYFVVVNNEYLSLYKDLLNVKCIHIPNVLDEFPEISEKKNNLRIVSVGKLTKIKGFDELIEVFKLVSLKIPEVKLDIIGDGPEKENIQNRIEAFNLAKNVTLHGYKTPYSVSKILDNSSIFVMTSLEESFGISILEAFSHGLPCVAFDSAQGAREIISNNWDGYLIPDRNYDKMTSRILDLIDNESRRSIMSSQARKKAEKYNIDLFLSKWKKILK
ncbi:MAG: glycosyltransferase [Mycoplasmatota bacterium]